MPDLQAWLPLGSQENALEEMGRLSERSELRPIFSALIIFSASIEEPPGNRQHQEPEADLRVLPPS